jgi:hypothetical protein
MQRRRFLTSTIGGVGSLALTRCGPAAVPRAGDGGRDVRLDAAPPPLDASLALDGRVLDGSLLDGARGGDASAPDLPPWAPAPGELRVLSPTNTFLSQNGMLAGWEDRFSKLFDFSGGVYTPYWGALGAMVLHGGGHASTYDNSVVLFDYDDLTFKRLSSPSPPSTFTHSHDDPLFDREHCEYGDGQPGAGHTYDTLAILPPEAGGAAAGSLVRVSSHAVHVAISANTGWSHRFDLVPGSDDGVWERWSTNGPTGYRSPGAASVYDPVRRRFWWIAQLSSVPSFLRYLDVTTREHNEVRFDEDEHAAPPASPDSPIMRYHPLRDLVVMSSSRSTRDALDLSYFLPEEGPRGWRPATLSAPIPHRGGFSHPFDYVPEIDALVMVSPADPEAVYELRVPEDPSSTWEVTRRPFEGVASIPTAYVSGKRWSYSSACRAFVWIADATAEVHAYRPFGT